MQPLMLSADEYEFLELCDSYGMRREDGASEHIPPAGSGWYLIGIETARNEDGAPFTLTHWARRKEQEK